tara:strand:+ start:1062 stop:1169 length:108 start_codon:yes stop_codon:yes gene_type:complete
MNPEEKNIERELNEEHKNVNAKMKHSNNIEFIEFQ